MTCIWDGILRPSIRRRRGDVTPRMAATRRGGWCHRGADGIHSRRRPHAPGPGPRPDLLCLPHPAAAVDNAALVNQLVTGSPWKGENIRERGMGSVTYDVVFAKDSGGRLTGVVSNYSIPAFASVANGPIKKPVLKNGVLTFETNRGTYQLSPRADGKWAGSARSLDRSFGATVTLIPATPAKK